MVKINKKIEKDIEKAIKKYPLGDDDIKFYLPDAKIITYSDLKKYKSIDELLPNNKSYAIILYEYEKNKGHWTCIMKYCDTIEFFDSLADCGAPDSELKWNSAETNKKLGYNKPYLTNLLKKSNYDVIYNKLKLQKENKKDIINTCGRHCVFRILNMRDKNMDLLAYLKFLNDVKNETGDDYDDIITHLVYENHIN